LVAVTAIVAGLVMNSHAQSIRLSDEQAARIGAKIWQNESGHTIGGLTAWNFGEEFASLGIGHFIWYPAGRRGPFEESFPPLNLQRLRCWPAVSAAAEQNEIHPANPRRGRPLLDLQQRFVDLRF